MSTASLRMRMKRCSRRWGACMRATVIAQHKKRSAAGDCWSVSGRAARPSLPARDQLMAATRSSSAWPQPRRAARAARAAQRSTPWARTTVTPTRTLTPLRWRRRSLTTAPTRRQRIRARWRSTWTRCTTATRRRAAPRRGRARAAARVTSRRRGATKKVSMGTRTCQSQCLAMASRYSMTATPRRRTPVQPTGRSASCSSGTARTSSRA
mmetsp:Transcript_11001/g.45672  ORF Transcript_11001/g.45672 Transcript_11001/m.45672 type:complete len:210 (-) Transcript_11001:854-1483(-)